MTHEKFARTAVAKAMLFDLAQSLQLGQELTIISADASSFDDNISVHSYDVMGNNTFLILSFFVSPIMFIRSIFKAKIVYCRSYPAMIVYGVTAKLLRKKVIFDTRGLFFDELADSGYFSHLKARWLFTKIELFLLSIANKVICVSDGQADYYLTKYCLAPSKLEVVYNGAPSIEFATSDQKLKQENQQIRSIKFVYVGSIVEWHSLPWILQFCNSLSKHVKLELDIITKDKLTAKKLSDNLEFTCNIFTKDFRKVGGAYDFGFSIITGGISKDVCCPVKLAEYLQSNVKVIASSNVGVHKTFIDKGNGVLLDLEKSIDENVSDFLYCYEDLIHRRTIAVPDELKFETQVNKIKSVIEALCRT